MIVLELDNNFCDSYQDHSTFKENYGILVASYTEGSTISCQYIRISTFEMINSLCLKKDLIVSVK